MDYQGKPVEKWRDPQWVATSWMMNKDNPDNLRQFIAMWNGFSDTYVPENERVAYRASVIRTLQKLPGMKSASEEVAKLNKQSAPARTATTPKQNVQMETAPSAAIRLAMAGDPGYLKGVVPTPQEPEQPQGIQIKPEDMAKLRPIEERALKLGETSLTAAEPTQPPTFGEVYKKAFTPSLGEAADVIGTLFDAFAGNKSFTQAAAERQERLSRQAANVSMYAVDPKRRELLARSVVAANKPFILSGQFQKEYPDYYDLLVKALPGTDPVKVAKDLDERNINEWLDVATQDFVRESPFKWFQTGYNVITTPAGKTGAEARKAMREVRQLDKQLWNIEESEYPSAAIAGTIAGNLTSYLAARELVGASTISEIVKQKGVARLVGMARKGVVPTPAYNWLLSRTLPATAAFTTTTALTSLFDAAAEVQATPEPDYGKAALNYTLDVAQGAIFATAMNIPGGTWLRIPTATFAPLTVSLGKTLIADGKLDKTDLINLTAQAGFNLILAGLGEGRMRSGWNYYKAQTDRLIGLQRLMQPAIGEAPARNLMRTQAMYQDVTSPAGVAMVAKLMPADFLTATAEAQNMYLNSVGKNLETNKFLPEAIQQATNEWVVNRANTQLPSQSALDKVDEVQKTVRGNVRKLVMQAKEAASSGDKAKAVELLTQAQNLSKSEANINNIKDAITQLQPEVQPSSQAARITQWEQSASQEERDQFNAVAGQKLIETGDGEEAVNQAVNQVMPPPEPPAGTKVTGGEDEIERFRKATQISERPLEPRPKLGRRIRNWWQTVYAELVAGEEAKAVGFARQAYRAMKQQVAKTVNPLKGRYAGLKREARSLLADEKISFNDARQLVEDYRDAQDIIKNLTPEQESQYPLLRQKAQETIDVLKDKLKDIPSAKVTKLFETVDVGRQITEAQTKLATTKALSDFMEQTFRRQRGWQGVNEKVLTDFGTYSVGVDGNLVNTGEPLSAILTGLYKKGLGPTSKVMRTALRDLEFINRGVDVAPTIAGQDAKLERENVIKEIKSKYPQYYGYVEDAAKRVANLMKRHLHEFMKVGGIEPMNYIRMVTANIPPKYRDPMLEAAREWLKDPANRAQLLEGLPEDTDNFIIGLAENIPVTDEPRGEVLNMIRQKIQENGFYTPYARIFQETDNGKNLEIITENEDLSRGKTGTADFLKNVVGTKKNVPVLDIDKQTILTITNMTKLIEQYRSAKAILDLAENAHKVAQDLDPALTGALESEIKEVEVGHQLTHAEKKQGYEVITLIHGGAKRSYIVHPELKKSLQGLGPRETAALRSFILWPFRMLAKLKVLTTTGSANIEFPFINVIRDAWMQGIIDPSLPPFPLSLMITVPLGTFSLAKNSALKLLSQYTPEQYHNIEEQLGRIQLQKISNQLNNMPNPNTISDPRTYQLAMEQRQALLARAKDVSSPGWLMRNDMVTRFYASGGAMSTLVEAMGINAKDLHDAYAYVTGQPRFKVAAQDLKQALEEWQAKPEGTTNLQHLQKAFGAFNRMTRPFGPLRNIFHILGGFAKFSENIGRVGLYTWGKTNIPGVKPARSDIEAGFWASEASTPFSRHGRSPILRTFAGITAYLNAQIQALDTFVRNFGKQPLRTLIGLAGTLAVFLLAWVWNNSDPKRRKIYQQSSAQTRYGSVPFVIGLTREQAQKLYGDAYVESVPPEEGYYTVAKFPMPFEAGAIFGALPTAALDWQVMNDPQGTENLIYALQNSISLPTLPTGFQGVREAFASGPTGWSQYYQRQLIAPSIQQTKERTEQYTPWTSQISVEASKKLNQVGIGVAPWQIDHVIREAVGGGARYPMEELDRVLRRNAPDRGELPSRLPAEELLIRRFAAVDPRFKYSATVERFNENFYGQKKTLGYKEGVETSWNAFMDETKKDYDAIKAAASKITPQLMTYPVLNEAVQTIKPINMLQKMVTLPIGLTGDQIRDYRLKLDYLEGQILGVANTISDDFIDKVKETSLEDRTEYIYWVTQPENKGGGAAIEGKDGLWLTPVDDFKQTITPLVFSPPAGGQLTLEQVMEDLQKDLTGVLAVTTDKSKRQRIEQQINVLDEELTKLLK